MSKDKREEVFLNYNLKVRNYILSRVNNIHLAEDICSNVFEKVYDKLESFDEKKASMSTWIFTITRNTLIDYYRTNHVDFELNEDINIEVEQDNEGLICTQENLDKLSNAIANLDDKEKKTIILHYYEGMPLNIACKQLGISYPYIKIIHRKALSKISKYFKQ